MLLVSNLDAAGEMPITVRITDEQQRAFDLKPEAVVALPALAGVTQITVRLPDDLAVGGTGNVRVSVTVGGVQSNNAVLKLLPPQ